MRILLPILLLLSYSLSAQLITTDPAAPVVDQALTITFDASQGTAGLEGIEGDVYIHTGVITENSNSGSDWQYVQTTWGVADDDWKLTPVEGEDDKYTYTFGPSIREYFGVPEEEEIRQVVMVFRNANGTQEGKAAGGGDIYIDVGSGGELSLTLTGDPGVRDYPLGKPLPITAGTTIEATIELFDNGELLTSITGQELNYELRLTKAGEHTIRVDATTGGQTVSDSFTLTAELVVELLAPDSRIIYTSPGEQFDLVATSYITDTYNLRISGNNGELPSTQGDTFRTILTVPDLPVVTYFIGTEYQGSSAQTSVTFVTGEPEITEVPDGLQPGATVEEDGSLSLLLRAPGKEDVFVLGNFTDWVPVAATRLKRSPDGGSFWLELPGDAFTADNSDGDLLYQYAIDGQDRFADPYSTLILDPNNDPFIGEETFAGIPEYPTGKTNGLITWLPLGGDNYDWQVDDFEEPEAERLVIYELLVRDFVAAHDFATLTDTLDYLERLGINAIELMPVNEFDGNISWGYNPAFHMALDKYYGSPTSLKALIDAAHARGIAVILDVVYNHATGQSPLIQMWPAADNEFAPGPDNPYANQQARHPFNVFTDLNHESELTQEYVKRTLTYWIEEFRIDGLRFDLSKGFTQNFSDDVGEWNQYDAERVAILKDYADHVWSIDDDTYMIMEHLGESREENELAQYGNGMYFWSGFQPHDAYLEASMGYNEGNKSNLAPALAENRGFDQRSLVAYMESHDEERMMYKNLSFGNSDGDYDVTEPGTALDRVELASAFFYSLPGPKMLWQFGELGYDFNINYCSDGRTDESCRTDPKPIVWEYRDDPDRQDVYATISDLLFLRNNYDYFHGEVTDSKLAGEAKYIHLSSDDGRAAIVGNFGVTRTSVANPFPEAGTYYSYFSDEALEITDPAAAIELGPGEYHVYLSQDIAPRGGRISTSLNDREVARLQFIVFPNPTSGQLTATFELDHAGHIDLQLLDMNGRRLRTLFSGRRGAGFQTFDAEVDRLASGIYFLRLTDGRASAVKRIMVR